MAQTFKPLDFKLLNRRMDYHQCIPSDEDKITMLSPAYTVMTDLYKTSAVTVGPHDSLNETNDRMIRKGVRMLLVTDDENKVVGLITATDILGEKPLNYINSNGGSHSDIQVSDIMTPYDSLEVLCWVDVEQARVGDIAETLKRVGRQHAIVVDGDFNAQVIRGVFSSSRIARETGEEVDTSSRAGNFADLGQVIMHGAA